MSIETCALQSRVERLAPSPPHFARHRPALDLCHLDDAAPDVDFRSDETDAAEDGTIPEPPRQEVDEAHPVEDRRIIVSGPTAAAKSFIAASRA